MAVNLNEEKLLCHISLLRGPYVMELEPLAGPAYFRAYIVQNRQSGRVSVKVRWNHTFGRPIWVDAPCHGTEDVSELSNSVKIILLKVFESRHINVPEDAIVFHYPPVDDGDAERTLAWLVENNLVNCPSPLRIRETEEEAVSAEDLVIE